jgi:tetratricopeptide (TPR) repeat protein
MPPTSAGPSVSCLPGQEPAVWDRFVEAVLAHDAAAPARLGAALAADPDQPVAHAVKGLMLLLLARPELLGDAHASLASADRLAAPDDPADAYRAALRSWLDGNPLAGAAQLERRLETMPQDALALKLSHQIRFMSGDVPGMLATLRRRSPAFAGTPHHGFVLGCLAFALEESGETDLAEATGRRAIELAPRDAWGRHAVAHCLEMTGRSREGAAWLDATRQTWKHCSNFSFHMYWHLALFLIEQRRFDAVLALYDAEIRAARTDDYRDLANGASLLARLDLEGIEVGDRWEELAEIAARRVHDRRLVFADLHYATALLGAGRTMDAEALAMTLAADAANGGSHDARVAAAAGAAAVEGLLAFQQGRYGEAAARLGRARPQMAWIGGSAAQRDLFEQMYIESLMRSGDLGKAERILAERSARRGGHNGFASRRLMQIAAGRTPALQVAARVVASLRPALAH